MSIIKNKVTSQFAEVTQYDQTTGNVLGITLGNVTVTNQTTLGAPANISVSGGQVGNVLASDGNGNLMINVSLVAEGGNVAANSSRNIRP